MALEALNWHTPASVLLELPLCHTEVASVPLAFTERVRDYASLPLPFFLRPSRLLLPLSEGLPEYPASLRAIPYSGKDCASLYLPPSGKLDIDGHPTSQDRVVSFASNLLPRRSFWPHYDTSQSKPLSLSFARELELDRSMLSLSPLPVRDLLPTSSNTLIGLSVQALGTHISCQFVSHH